jgi:hypothetical protein
MVHKYHLLIVGSHQVGKRYLAFQFTGNFGKTIKHKFQMKNNYFEITINFISTTLNNEELIKKADGFMFIFSKY